MMMNGDQLYELAQIREHEFMHEATLRRSRGRRGDTRAIRLLQGAARRLRHGPAGRS